MGKLAQMPLASNISNGYQYGEGEDNTDPQHFIGNWDGRSTLPKPGPDQKYLSGLPHEYQKCTASIHIDSKN